MEKKEILCTVGGDVNWYSHYGEQYRGSFKKERKEGRKKEWEGGWKEGRKKKKKLPYNTRIPLLGIYLKKMK